MPEKHSSYKEEISLIDMTREEFLAIALKVVNIFEWATETITKDSIIALRQDSSGSAEERISITVSDPEKAIIKSASLEEHATDWGRNRKNVEFFIDTFNETAGNLSDIQLENLKNEYKANIQEQDIQEEEQSPDASAAESEEEEESEIPGGNLIERKRFRSILDIIVPEEGYFVTPILVMINVGIFALMAFTGAGFFSLDHKSLLTWGALSEVFIAKGEYYKLLTACFLHMGVIHLLLNMFFLVMIGAVLERAIGRFWFLAAFILTGIGAHILSLDFTNPHTMVGASGAVFGMIGVYLVMLSMNVIRLNLKDRLFNIALIIIAADLVAGLFVDAYSLNVNIKAHLWGLVTGILIGFAMYPTLKPERPEGLRYAMALILAVVLIITVTAKIPKGTQFNRILTETGTGMVTTPVNTELEDMYNRKMDEIMLNDRRGVAIVKQQNPGNLKIFARKLRDSGSYYWNENIRLINDLQIYNWSANRQNMLEDLKNYCSLRVKYNDLLLKIIKGNRQEYVSLIRVYIHNIDSISKHVSNVHNY